MARLRRLSVTCSSRRFAGDDKQRPARRPGDGAQIARFRAAEVREKHEPAFIGVLNKVDSTAGTAVGVNRRKKRRSLNLMHLLRALGGFGKPFLVARDWVEHGQKRTKA